MLIKHYGFLTQFGREMGCLADLFCINHWQIAASTLPFSSLFDLFLIVLPPPLSPTQKENFRSIHNFSITVFFYYLSGNPVDWASDTRNCTVLGRVHISSPVYNMELSRSIKTQRAMLSVALNYTELNAMCWLAWKQLLIGWLPCAPRASPLKENESRACPNTQSVIKNWICCYLTERKGRGSRLKTDERIVADDAKEKLKWN